MRHRRLVLIFAALSSACAASSGMGGPRVLAEGNNEFGFGVEAGISAAQISPAEPARAPWPQIGLSYRRGLGGDFDLGVRAWGFGLPGRAFGAGLGADTKYALLRAPSEEDGADISVSLGASYHQLNIAEIPTHLLSFQIPLKAGHNLGGGHQLYGGLSFELHTMLGPSINPVHIPFYGISVGFVWKALEGVEIRPELSLLYSPIGFNGTLDDTDRSGMTIAQLSLGHAFSF